ncbi:MAG TPA: alpha/beta hydrolase [Thermoanaerobaculia bacterium]|nr:alpha/beta hydrolase [Thermoanaerobaculia bacterium]
MSFNASRRAWRTPVAATLALAALALAAGPALAADPLAPGEHTFDVGGVELRYVVAGQGQPVLLLHGFTASVETNWRTPGVFDALAERFLVIALDQRGHGKSGKPHEPSAYGAEMVHDVIRLLDHVGLPKAHVVGYSMGGFITLELAAAAPERLLSAVLGGAGWRPPTGPDPMMEELAASLERGEGIGPLLDALTPAGQTMSAEQKAFANQRVLADNDPAALAAVVRGMGSLGVPESALNAIEIPILAVVGSLDPLAAGVDALSERLPRVVVERIEGADHLTAVASPLLRESILEFLLRLCNCA